MRGDVAEQRGDAAQTQQRIGNGHPRRATVRTSAVGPSQTGIRSPRLFLSTMHRLSLGWFSRDAAVLLICLHQSFTAVIPATGWSLPGCAGVVQRESITFAASTQTLHKLPPEASIAAGAAARQVAVASCCARTGLSASRPVAQVLCSSESAGDKGLEVAVDRDGVTATEDDPFRPERASVSPLVINALLPILFSERGDTEAADAAAAVLEKRRSRSDWRLTEEEERTITNRVCGVANALPELRFMLAAAVGRTPSIAKYGMLSDYGMTENVEDDPLAKMNQAECLLALYMLHKEKAGAAAVDFLDADRLEVLQG